MTLQSIAANAEGAEWRSATDARLVKGCLAGDDGAWAALIHRYKALIYSVPRRYGAPAEDASDIFQAVCLELFSELPRLRETGAVRAWIVAVAVHQSFQWKRRQRRTLQQDLDDVDETLAADAEPPASILMRLEREQQVRDAVARLPPRCESIIRLLFYRHPPMPYREIAGRMGLADGSIGYMRARCLKRLRRMLPPEEFERDDG